MTLWLKVTDDEYELPLIVADTCEELAQKCGLKVNSIYKHIWRHKVGENKKERAIYQKVEVEWDE